MKEIILAIALLLSINKCFSQTYSYNKVLAQGQKVKMKGKITLSDTLVSIYTNNVPANFKVKKALDTNQVKQFKVVGIGDDNKIRITFNNNPDVKKKELKTLLLETRDDFSGNFTTVLYYLKKESN